jgi:pectate lyase
MTSTTVSNPGLNLRTQRLFGVATFVLGALVASAPTAPAQNTKSSANAAPDFSLIGYATMGRGTTGGAGGVTNTVSTAAEFLAAIQDDEPRTILVSGPIDLGQSGAKINSNKTILGVGTNAGFIGNVSIVDASNIILRNLHFPLPGSVAQGDGLNTTRAHHLWVDHCNFGDCTDGQFDITHGSDFITISWCKFSYTDPANRHRLSMLIGNRDDTGATDRGKLNVTLHHNWYGNLVNQRMPRARYGNIHIFNAYYNATGDKYCIGLGCTAQVLLESTYFDGVTTPWRNQNFSDPGCVPGVIQWNDDNVFVNSKMPTNVPNSTVFTPPYAYKLDAGKDVKDIVRNNAGVGQGPFAPK